MLRELLKERILCTDGGIGTSLQAADLAAEDYGGEALEGCMEQLNSTRPDVVEEVHRRFLDAGADIIETNTFGASRIVLAEYPPLDQQVREINLRGAQIARRAADAATTTDQPRFVAGSLGPTTKPISVTGGVSFAELVDAYGEQARALVEGGVDYLLLETCQDTRNVKAGIVGVQRALEELGRDVPLAISGTIESTGTMLAGQAADALSVSVGHLDLLYIGLNCATGPDFMTDHLRALHESAHCPVACVPNAGLPDSDGRYQEGPGDMAAVLGRFVEEGWLNVVGGCCGTGPEHIAAFAELCRSKRPRPVPSRPRRSQFSGLEVVDVNDENRPVLVGERTNSLGSRKFRRLIATGKLDEAREIARRQIARGAQIIDICLQNTDRDEAEDMRLFLKSLQGIIKVPLMIDSTDAAAVELALRHSQGKAIINSINLEDGLGRFEEVVPLARQYGAGLVVGCIDEDPDQGMAVSRERKLAIAKRSVEILTDRFGVPPTDIILDPLTFPCATGDAAYEGSATETVEGLRLIKQALPACKTVLGISNVSFGLPPAGREVLNSVFLYHCTKAGLDLAIVNTQKLERYASLAPDERELAEDVLFHTSDEAIAAFAAKFRDAVARRDEREAAPALPLDERLARFVVEGRKPGLLADLDRKLAQASPLDIVNGPLMKGMQEVGRLFNDNKLIVAEVLQSAEVMKAAVSHLEPHLDKDATTHRGTVVLATVKGDVHDVGKNLVDIVFSNNGYRVINLGLKVPPGRLLEAVAEHEPDIVGLSGLLVRSAQQMVVTAQELSVHGRCPPLLVGGAALTRGFTERRIAPEYDGLVAYAQDAMSGLELANRIMVPEQRRGLEAELEALAPPSRPTPSSAPPRASVPPGPPSVPMLAPEKVPQAPDFERHVVRQLPLDVIWSYVNPRMLYGKHLGLRGDPEALLAAADPTACFLHELIAGLKAECRDDGAMTVSAVWQFYPAEGEGNVVTLFNPEDRQQVAAKFAFPRQPGGERLCLADLVARPNGRQRDSVCLFTVTAGSGIRERYQQYRDDGEYLRSHAVQALAVETAEAAAEWLHEKLREDWGIADPPDLSMRDKLKARYRGRRYSFGFPACPDLDKQVRLFELLRPDEIGVTLTGECMMDPEASVTAIVMHHPAATYFSAEPRRGRSR